MSNPVTTLPDDTWKSNDYINAAADYVKPPVKAGIMAALASAVGLVAAEKIEPQVNLVVDASVDSSADSSKWSVNKSRGWCTIS